MKKFNLFLGGLMAIAFTACTNEDFMQEGNSNAPSAEKITITAYTPGDNSASSRITQNEEGNKIKLTWDGVEYISVVRGEEHVIFSAEGGNEFSTTDEMPEGNGDFYAVYPAIEDEAVINGPEIVPFDLSNQTGADAYLMYATSPADDGTTYQFHHAAAYLKATFTFPAEANVSDATITLTVPQGVYTKGNINLTDGTLTGTNTNTITKKVNFTESTEVWFALPPMTAGDNTLKFRVNTANETYVGQLSGTQAILAGCYYDAEVSLNNAVVCELPTNLSNYFNSGQNKININNSYNSVIFEVNSNKPTSGNGVLTIGTSGAYAKVENNGIYKDIYIYTNADEIKFNQNCKSMFYGNGSCFKNVKKIIFGNGINTSNVTNMSQMFEGCFKLESIDFGNNFDTSNVTNMFAMFSACYSLQTLDLSSFNTAKVTNMSYMFDIYSYGSGSNYPLSSIVFGDNFTTENVTDMTRMFAYCQKINPLHLCNFTFKDGVTLTEMFDGCDAPQYPGSYTYNYITIYVKDAIDRNKLLNGGTAKKERNTYIKVCTTHGKPL